MPSKRGHIRIRSDPLVIVEPELLYYSVESEGNVSCLFVAYSLDIIFYVLFATSLLTEFRVVNGPKESKEIMVAIHVKSLYYLLVFIILHLGVVFIADLGDEQ